MKAADHLAGLVVDEFGNRLADAATWHLGSPSAKTDGQGRFTIPLTDNQRSWAGDKYVVRVSLPGFRPRTRAVAAGAVEPFVMRRDSAAVWTPLRCSLTRRAIWRLSDKGTALSGPGVAFRVPRGIEISDDGQNEHGKHESVCRGEACMLHVTSFEWPSPPTEGFVGGFNVLSERDINYGSALVGLEYRGSYPDGTYARRIETPGDLVAYEHLSKASADYFDKIIDSMCWMDRD